MPMLTRIIENTINKSAISFNNCMDEDYSEDVIQCLYNIYPYIFEDDIINNDIINGTSGKFTLDYLGSLYEMGLQLTSKDRKSVV